MKKLILLISVLMAVSCTPRQPKTLVAYFSATGTTKAAAEDLARVAGADLLAITPAVPYTDADLNWRDSLSRSSLEMKDLTSRPALASTEVDIAAYDRVFIGFPIWWYTAPTVINTFIESLPLAGKQVALFATSGGSTIEKACTDLAQQYPDIEWQPGLLLNEYTEEQLADFAR